MTTMAFPYVFGFTLGGAAAPALTGHGLLTAAVKQVATASLPGHGLLTATAVSGTPARAASLSGHGALTTAPNGAYGGRHLTGQGVLTATGKAKFAVAAVLAGHGVLTTAPNGAYGGRALTGHGLLVAVAKPKFASAAVLAGHGVLTTAPNGAYGGISLTGHGLLTAPIKVKSTATLTGHGALAPTDGAFTAPQLAAHGLLAATAYAKYLRPAALSGPGVLTTAPSGPYVVDTATLTGHGVLSVTAKATKFVLPCALAGAGLLTSLASGSGQRTAALAGQGLLSAAARMFSLHADAVLAGHGALVATAYARFAAAAALLGHGVLSALVEAEFTRAATLTGHGALAASAGATEFDTAVLAGHGALTATTVTKELGFFGFGTLSADIGGIDVTIVHEQLEIVCTNNYFTLQSEDPYDLTGSFVFAECIQTPNISDGSTEALLYVYEAPTSGAGYIVRVGYSAGNFICEDNGGSGTTMTNRYTTTFDLSIHKWWRIRESAGTVYWDYSADSLHWTNATTQTISPINDLYVGFISGCDADATSPGIAMWDNFNVFTVPAGPSGQGQLSATINVIDRSAALSGHGALTCSAQQEIQAQLAGQGVLTATASLLRISVVCNLGGQGTLSAVGVATERSAALSGHGALTAACAPRYAVTLPAHGTLASTAALPAHATLSGRGVLSTAATGPKTDTLYDAFARKNLTKWTGWSTDSLSIVYKATFDSAPALGSYAHLSAVITEPTPASRTTNVGGNGRTATVNARTVTVPAEKRRTSTATSEGRTIVNRPDRAVRVLR